ncbi:MAG: T9SS C-terminal target domain-containing protein [Ignavibacteriae bacterium]|nr:MAG: T9SS C-terminal target domain-containing protein [Ignavibacteriota bacterium]
MKNKYTYIVILLVLAPLTFINFTVNEDVFQKSPLEKYSQVRVNITNPGDILTLQMNDIDVEHYRGNMHDGIIIEINQEELARLRNTGLSHEVVIPDMDEYYRNRPAPSESDMLQSRILQEKDNVFGFSYGSMGGFYTYTEVVQKLDSMRLLYPNLITAKMDKGTTYEGRKMWAVKISDNPDVNESAIEPAIYFDALHHAREPQSMASLMYYMYWLLENYNSNPEVAHLLNNREIFIIPVVNPDGYVRNQTTNPNGGGSWRKNRTPYGGYFGVDLNRNYSYKWGYDNIGSSGNPSSDTYRGPSAASEAETQAVQTLMQQISPKIGFSMHSVAGRYLNPYGYTDSSVSYDIYADFTSDFASENNYTYGTVFQMLDYYSNGTTRDYMHSIGGYCWTPEVGGSGFWPGVSEIIPIASENLEGLKYLTWVGGGYARFQNYNILGSGYVQKNDTLRFQVTIRNKGLSRAAKNVVVDITTSYPNVAAITASQNYDSISARQMKTNTNPFVFRLNASANYLDEMKLVVSVKQENVLTHRDTISIIVGKANIMFSDNAESGTGNWTKSGNQIQWDTTGIAYFGPGHSFADSRYGNSRNSTQNYFTLNNPVNLSNTVNPRLEFFAKWSTEASYDYVRIQISTDGGSIWSNLAGRFTSTVSGQPSYHANQSWIYERISLNSYIGQTIRFRYYYYTDNGIPGDGFYFDNFRIVNYTNETVGVTSNSGLIPDKFALYQNYPNPFNPVTNIRFDIAKTSHVQIKIYDIQGREVEEIVNSSFNPGSYDVQWNALNSATGVYFYEITAGDFKDIKKMILVK